MVGFKVFLITLTIVMLGIQLSASLTPVRKCNKDIPMPLAVQVDDCSEMPCDVWKGHNTDMSIQFVATRNEMMQLKADVHITTLGVQLPFELDEESSDVCRNLLYGAYCPLYKEEDVTYHLALPIAEHQPEVPIKVEVAVVDSVDNSVVSCFILDARVRRH